jgi:hypothetical protein
VIIIYTNRPSGVVAYLVATLESASKLSGTIARDINLLATLPSVNNERSRKKSSHGKKARAMARASDVDSNSAYSSPSSSSSEDEGDQHKNKKSSKNMSRLSCFVIEGFYGTARGSGS